jgi:RNA polymerase sigma-70 factor, ECF subfamily
LNPIRDEELMLAVGRGDVEAFETLVLRHQASAWNIAYRFVGNKADAEDIVQDTFLRLLNAAPHYRPSASFRTYFSTIISRLCLDHLYKKRPQPQAELPDQIDPTPGPDHQLIDQEKALRIRDCIAALPPRQRLVVVLKYYEYYNYKDIAEAMDTTEKSVERLLARARVALANVLKDSS